MHELRIYEVPQPGTVERADAPLIDPTDPAYPVPGEASFDELLHPEEYP